MDFSALIKKSFEIAWHNRVLWLFGFLSGGVGTVGYINPSGFNFTIPSSTPEPSDSQLQAVGRVLGVSDSPSSLISSPTFILIILAIVAVLLILVLLGIFIANWAAAALVYLILQRNAQRPTFGVGVRAGLKYWWKFWLLALVIGLFILAFILALAIPAVFLFLARFTTLAVIFTVIAVIVFILAMFVIASIGSLIISLAQRMIIHKETGVFDSIRLSGGLVKKYLGESLLTYIVAVGINFAAGFAAMFAILPIGIVIAVLFFMKLWWVAIFALTP
ncbi:MAG TPA: hypothetical protein VF303_04135, partial [Candidatus Nanoarchaeia archaeon]